MLDEVSTEDEAIKIEKARYCRRCNNYLPIAEFADAGLLKSKICNRHSPVAQSTTRWCTVCDDFICVSLFRKAGQNFLCKKHMYDKVGRKAMAKQRNDPEKVGYNSIRNICYIDMKTFKQSTIGLKREEILLLTRSLSKDELLNFAIVPIDPTQVMSLENAVVISRKLRVKMIQIFKNNDQERYEKIARKQKKRNTA